MPLVEHRVLRSLPPDDQRAVLAMARRRRFARNEVVFHEGDLGDTLHLLAQHGTIRRATPLPHACNALVATEATRVIHDVAADTAYHACFPDARALIALPAGRASHLLITSEHQGAFGLADRALLELVARHLADAEQGD